MGKIGVVGRNDIKFSVASADGRLFKARVEEGLCQYQLEPAEVKGIVIARGSDGAYDMDGLAEPDIVRKKLSPQERAQRMRKSRDMAYIEYMSGIELMAGSCTIATVCLVKMCAIIHVAWRLYPA